ncbi:MAG: SurA N-terminal domain-containing protein [Alphaproteobacteria bacterium]|nr:SurA N-terminal domain-containing protein [Alphaproteobacteria bacterium]
MLQIMRDLGKSWTFKTLMGLLIVSFAVWGIGDIFRGNPQQREVAKAGAVSVTVQDIEMEFQKSMLEARRTFGPELTTQQARQMGVMDRALNMLIERVEFDQEIKRLGISVSNQFILGKLASLPNFRDKDGNFNKQLWEMFLRQNGVNEEQFMQNEKREEARRQLFKALTANTTAPASMIDNLYMARGQKRILEVLTLENSSIANLAAPDDATLQKFHEKNASKFTAPEYRNITIAKLSTTDMAKDVSVTDDDLKTAYESKKSEFAQPEQRDLEQIVLQDEAKAKEIVELVKNNGDFIKIAKSKGLDVITLNHKEENSIVPELYEAGLKLKDKQVSDPIKTDLGWHVLRIKKIYPATEPTFADVKDKLRAQLQNEQAVDGITRAVNQLDDALAAGKSLEDIADSLKMRLIKIPAIDANGIDPDNKPTTELPAEKDVLRAAFGQAAGETSQVIEDKKETGSDYIVVRTEDVTASQLRPYDLVKKQVLAAWSTDEQAKKAMESAEKIAQEMRNGKTATSFAVRPGVDVRLSKPITLLGDTDNNIPKTILKQVVRMQRGDVLTSSTPDKQYVLRLADIIQVDPKNPDEGKRKVIDDFEDQMPMDILEQYSKNLRKVFPVKIHKDMMDMLRNQDNG